jgi:hypothetical protein
MRERALQLDSIGAVRMQSSGGVAAVPNPSRTSTNTNTNAAVDQTGVGGAIATQAPASARALLPYLNNARNAAGLPPIVPPTVAPATPSTEPLPGAPGTTVTNKVAP